MTAPARVGIPITSSLGGSEGRMHCSGSAPTRAGGGAGGAGAGTGGVNSKMITQSAMTYTRRVNRRGHGGHITERSLRTLTSPGIYGDGANLFLRVRPGVGTEVTRAWVAVVRFPAGPGGRRLDIGLGAANVTTLAQARDACARIRAKVAAGIDPRTVPSLAPVAQAVAAATGHTLDAVLTAFCAESARAWSAKTAKLFPARVRRHCAALLARDVATLDSDSISAALRPIWTQQTGRIVRFYLVQLLDWAAGKKYCTRGADLWADVASTLKPLGKVTKGNFAAARWQDVNAIIRAMHAGSSSDATKAAFEFCILTATRSGETRGATWAEVDLSTAMWTIPAERMKMDRPHRVALSPRAVAILREQKPCIASALIFPGEGKGGAMSDTAFSGALGRMANRGLPVARDKNGATITMHGMRAAFTTWGQETGQPKDAIEFALAHVESNKVRAAYARSDLLEQRWSLMADWARQCHDGAGQL